MISANMFSIIIIIIIIIIKKRFLSGEEPLIKQIIITHSNHSVTLMTKVEIIDFFAKTYSNIDLYNNFDANNDYFD